MKAQGTPLREARVVFFGAGSSAVGVATMIAQLIEKEEGLPFDEAKRVRPAHRIRVFSRVYCSGVLGLQGW